MEIATYTSIRCLYKTSKSHPVEIRLSESFCEHRLSVGIFSFGHNFPMFIRNLLDLDTFTMTNQLNPMDTKQISLAYFSGN